MRKAAFLISSLFLLSSCTHVLFEDSVSEYTIVIDKEAPASEQYAATELQTWIKEVCGVTLPVGGLDEGEPGKRLVVGYNPVVEELVKDAEAQSPSDDSFTWCSKGGDILFWGGSERGTLYSVYDFLEDQLGCRWYRAEVSVAPKQDSWSFKKLYNHEDPGIIVRDNCMRSPRSNAVFSARLRNNVVRLPGANPGETLPGTAEGYWGVHAMVSHCPPQKYFAEQPEYYGMVNGKRVATPWECQLCLSNPDVLQICTESLRKVMRENPDYMVYSMEQGDNWSYCTCPECNAIAEQYGGQSGLNLWFVNQVADAIKDEFPDKYVGTFAYRYTRHAPKGIVPRDNVVIRLCSIECCLLHEFAGCEQNLPFVMDMQDWAAISKNLYIWEYVTDFRHYLLPIANIRLLQPKLQDFRASNAIGVLEQGDYQTRSCELKDLRAYLVSKLLWNPDIDVEAVIYDFTEGYYGAAGQYIRQYIDYSDQFLRRAGMHADCYAIPEHKMYSKGYIKRVLQILSEGKKAVADNPELVKRVEAAELPFCYLALETIPHEAYPMKLDKQFKKIVEQEGIVRMSEQADVPSVATYVARLDELAAMFRDNADQLPALNVKPSGQGVAYKRYEGQYLTTAEMFRKGKLTDTGVMPTITIDSDEAKDHFGYIFNTLVAAPIDGVYVIEVHADDLVEISIDGKKHMRHTESWTRHPSKAYVNLQKGFHKLEVKYIEDTEGQNLDIKFIAPGGYEATLPAEVCFLP